MFKDVNTEVSAAGKVTQSVKGIFGLSVWIRNASEDVQPVSQTRCGVLSAHRLTAWPSPAGSQRRHRGTSTSSAGTQDPVWAPASPITLLPSRSIWGSTSSAGQQQWQMQLSALQVGTEGKSWDLKSLLGDFNVRQNKALDNAGLNVCS